MRRKQRSETVHPTGETDVTASHDDLEDICDIREGSPVDQRHVLLNIDDGFRHLWLAGSPEEIPVTDIGPSEISGLMEFYLDQLSGRSDHGTRSGGLLRFQSFGSNMETLETDDIDESAVSVIREDELINIRLESGDSRYTIIYDTKPSNAKLGSYAVSRLRSRGCSNVPDLLGISYWDRPSGPLAWSSMVRHRVDSYPSFRPYLRDLDDVFKSILAAGPEGYHDYIIELSRNNDIESFLLSRKLGRSLGNIHGNLVVGRKEVSPRASGALGERIARILSLGEFTMEDVGSILGMVSSYILRVKRELRTRSGKDSPVTDPGGRKLKVLKRRSSESTPMGILSRSFRGREAAIKNRFAKLRDFRGSPSIASLLDSRLEKVVISGGNFIFDRFNWFPSGFENDVVMMLPLKDLALSLNSLMKNRYLSARKVLRDLSVSFNVDIGSLESMYIDYNLSKRNYDGMRRDLTISRFLSDSDSPFGSILAVSVASALWYDRCRNEIITGYTEGIESTGREELLEYPEKANTLDGIDLLQIFVSLSELSRNFSPGAASSVGTESALLTVLTR